RVGAETDRQRARRALLVAEPRVQLREPDRPVGCLAPLRQREHLLENLGAILGAIVAREEREQPPQDLEALRDRVERRAVDLDRLIRLVLRENLAETQRE